MEGRERTQRHEDSASQTVTSTWMLYNKDTDEMVYVCFVCLHPIPLFLSSNGLFFFFF